MADTLSSQIYLSRESIRAQISDQVKSYLELENVDLTKSSFLSFIVDTISTLTSNLLFYQLSTYREFFLTTAQLPESILNLSAFLGYNTTEASFANVNLLMTIPFGFDDPLTSFTIPDGFKFNADGDVDFRTYYDLTITVTNNAEVSILYIEDNKKFNLPVSINPDGESFSFVMPARQINEVVQEFQIDGDTQQYQFVVLDIPLAGQVADLTIQIKNIGDAGFTTWTEFSSLFLMSPTDKGYVSRRTDTGRRLSFGNGLIGEQPEAGATVLTTTGVTNGSAGNVIAGSIREGERIYVTTLAGLNQIVNYEVINNSAAFNGEDEESLEEVRSNSIASITALNRLVTEGDYQNINVIEPDLPLAQNALPILKRSDLLVNEIELFSGLIYGTGTDEVDNLVPTRNAVFTVPPGTSLIPRDDLITIGDDQYYTMFGITIEPINTVGLYEYIIYAIDIIPALETSFPSTYDIYSDLLTVERSGTEGIFQLFYKSTQGDADLATCEMVIQSTGATFAMTNDSTAEYFVYTFDPFTDIPEGEQTYEFTISEPGGDPVAKYSNKVTFRKDLSAFMRSNVVDDTTALIVYDVPVIEKDYYDAVDQRAFELEILQVIVNTVDLADKKMLTDFVNIKFTNTHGLLSGMQLNPTTHTAVVDILETEPTSCSLGDSFIITDEGIYQDNIITCIDATAVTFTYEQPIADSILTVTNLGTKYIYSERGWITIPLYTIPLLLEVEVFREETFSGTLSSMQTTVRETIVEAFEDRFGTNAFIYRSEIIDVVQEIDGVSHCRLIKPETSIVFTFDLQELTQEQLLRYGPEYVYFQEENITVRVL